MPDRVPISAKLADGWTIVTKDHSLFGAMGSIRCSSPPTDSEVLTRSAGRRHRRNS